MPGRVDPAGYTVLRGKLEAPNGGLFYWTNSAIENTEIVEEAMAQELMSGAEIVLKALADQGVAHVFGYPGGAVLPIYDEFFQQEKVKHILVRHEQGATHLIGIDAFQECDTVGITRPCTKHNWLVKDGA